MLRHIAFGCLVVGFAALAVTGLSGWARTRDVGPRDEIPLLVGHFEGADVTHLVLMAGNPWTAQNEDVERMKRDLPPDPWGLDAAAEIEKGNRRLVHDLVVRMPSGRMRWPEVLAKLRESFEPADIKVLTGKPEVSNEVVVEIAKKPKWSGFEILSHVMNASQKTIMFDVTTEGIVIGTDEACKRLRQRATLTESRRRVALENADKRLDAAFRPDLVDATIVAFARALTAQTGIEVVVDARIWENIPAIKWRGEPRSLHDALTEFCDTIRAFWRYHDGRVWLLRP